MITASLMADIFAPVYSSLTFICSSLDLQSYARIDSSACKGTTARSEVPRVYHLLFTQRRVKEATLASHLHLLAKLKPPGLNARLAHAIERIQSLTRTDW